ncbi:hypothetical protein KKE48_02505 [Patescibacteria group bacterium]|nr:hypothetical protein [Patescibacteria group bacterium]MBU1499715.1 hypothetical protein [Patescibacteria group bacterium]
MQTEIYNSLFDQSKLDKASAQPWRIGADARPIDSSFKIEDPRIIRASKLPEDFSITIGGLCSIFTGDLGTNLEKKAVNLIRMDQIVEAVGTVKDKPAFIIIEDSFFEKLTGIEQKMFQQQGKEAVVRIEKFLKLTNPSLTNLYFSFTSDVALDKGLKDLVKYFSSDILKNPNFSKIQAAPVLLMYTGFWPQLLNQLGFIPSASVVCVEPVNHFVDDRLLPDSLTTAYWDFLNWLENNPYGVNKSVNSNFGIAGFQESIAIDGTQRRSRLLNFSSVPNTQNWLTWTKDNLENYLMMFPFPLKNNPIFISGVNWGLSNPEINQSLRKLISLESSYYQEKKETPKTQRNREWAKKLKQEFRSETKNDITLICDQTGKIIQQILGNL